MPSDRTDHRASDDETLLLGLADADALAFAEACSRTLAAAAAVTRRLLPERDVEPVMRRVYARLWREPPGSGPLEGWVRRQCFETAVAAARERDQAPVAPSAQLAAPDLPLPRGGFLDASERALAALDPGGRAALVRAHDAGLRSSAPEAPARGAAATRALLALAEGGHTAPIGDARAADWVLGLLPAAEAAEVSSAVGGWDAPLARALRRGRRRLEGLAPGADVAARVVAATLAAAPPAPAATVEAHARLEVRAPEPAAPEQPPAAPEEPPAAPASASPYAALLDDDDEEGDDDPWARFPALEAADPGQAGAAPEPRAAGAGDDDHAPGGERPPRRRLALVTVGWLVAIAAAVGAGMVIGRLLLEAGVLQ